MQHIDQSQFVVPREISLSVFEEMALRHWNEAAGEFDLDSMKNEFVTVMDVAIAEIVVSVLDNGGVCEDADAAILTFRTSVAAAFHGIQ